MLSGLYKHSTVQTVMPRMNNFTKHLEDCSQVTVEAGQWSYKHACKPVLLDYAGVSQPQTNNPDLLDGLSNLPHTKEEIQFCFFVLSFSGPNLGNFNLGNFNLGNSFCREFGMLMSF